MTAASALVVPPDSPMDDGDDYHHHGGRRGVVSSSIVSSEQTAIMSSSSHHHGHHPQIRHAGRAHVRGKIRRVWRPRYLELWDNALLRYYELPASADIALQSDKDWDHYNMISKYTLAVFHARILDVTTLRDMHVGLPQASFGFVFRGQRLTHFESSSSYSSPTGAAVALNPMNVQCGMQPKEAPLPEQRDFFCAVSSLEEAQVSFFYEKSEKNKETCSIIQTNSIKHL